MVVNEEEYLNGFKSDLMEVVFAWCQGASFASIWYVAVLPSTVAYLLTKCSIAK